jgi:peptidoglycan hydrolase CwlO-like protein
MSYKRTLLISDHASSRDTPDQTSESETPSASDWYRQFLDLAARAPPQIVPQIQYDLAMSELRTARKVISDQAAELKASQVSHQDLATEIEAIQAKASASEKEVQQLKETVEFYRSNIRDTLREVGNDKENDGLDQMNDEQLWSELVCPHE